MSVIGVSVCLCVCVSVCVCGGANVYGNLVILKGKEKSTK